MSTSISTASYNMTSTHPPPAMRRFAGLSSKTVEVQEIQLKKDALATLENALKKRVTELRELCLKEGELTGQLPCDYPLQPREPIPQVRRRNQSNDSSNLNPIKTILPKDFSLTHCSDSTTSQRSKESIHHRNIPIAPPRPTSTNSTSSSISTTSSNTRSNSSVPLSNSSAPHSSSSSSSFALKSHSHLSMYSNPPTTINFYSQPEYSDGSREMLTQNYLKTHEPKPLYSNENFQPFYEETKPFQMSDFYKYSSKHRQKVVDCQKTTRQLQEEAARKNISNDDSIQASVKLIEKSGQKLIEVTARAIASNPSIAEKINSILPRSDNCLQD